MSLGKSAFADFTSWKEQEKHSEDTALVQSLIMASFAVWRSVLVSAGTELSLFWLGLNHDKEYQEDVCSEVFFLFLVKLRPILAFYELSITSSNTTQ